VNAGSSSAARMAVVAAIISSRFVIAYDCAKCTAFT
jgi:hypothetical protein